MSYHRINGKHPLEAGFQGYSITPQNTYLNENILDYIFRNNYLMAINDMRTTFVKQF